MDILSYNNIVETTATPVALSGLQFLYDLYVGNLSSEQASYDAMLMLGSLLSSKVINNALLSKMVGIFKNGYATNLTSLLTTPVLNYFIYNYLYENNFKTKFVSYVQKSNMELMAIPVLQGFMSQFFDQMIISWITGGSSSSYNL